MDIYCIRKKHPRDIFFYMFVENAYILQNFQEMFMRNQVFYLWKG